MIAIPFRRFVGIDRGREHVSDGSTLLQFWQWLDRHGLTRRIFGVINVHLAEKILMLREGTIVDARRIIAPPSTKNRDYTRDPEMHQTKKGNEYYFGVMTHVRSDALTGIVQSLKGMPADVADVTQPRCLQYFELFEQLFTSNLFSY